MLLVLAPRQSGAAPWFNESGNPFEISDFSNGWNHYTMSAARGVHCRQPSMNARPFVRSFYHGKGKRQLASSFSAAAKGRPNGGTEKPFIAARAADSRLASSYMLTQNVLAYPRRFARLMGRSNLSESKCSPIFSPPCESAFPATPFLKIGKGVWGLAPMTTHCP